MSYALFAVGVAWEERGNHEKAERSYWMSLEEDPDNQGARFNLATSFLGHSHGKTKQDRVKESLDWLSEIREEDTDWHRDQMWYRAAYAGAAARLRWVESSNQAQEKKEEQLKHALRGAIEAARDVEKQLQKTERRLPRRRRKRDLLEFLLKTEGGTLALLASLLCENGIHAKGADGPKDRNELEKALDVCCKAWPKDSDIPSECRALSHAKLVKFIEAEKLADGSKVTENGRTRFNLACYYSRIGGFDKSLTHLERALELRPDVFAPAKDDPGLRKVKQARRRRFKELMDAHNPRQKDGNGPMKQVLEAVSRASTKNPT
jgi:tetratricopeptide (TPR) repeat protein